MASASCLCVNDFGVLRDSKSGLTNIICSRLENVIKNWFWTSVQVASALKFLSEMLLSGLFSVTAQVLILRTQDRIVCKRHFLAISFQLCNMTCRRCVQDISVVFASSPFFLQEKVAFSLSCALSFEALAYWTAYQYITHREPLN